MTASNHRRAARNGLRPTLLAGLAMATLLTLLPAASAGAGKPIGRPVLFDDVIARRVLTGGVQAVSIAVSRNGKVVYTRAYGMADPRTRARATPDSRFRLGSITKTLTAVAVMREVERGRLSLNSRLVAVAPAGVIPKQHDRRLDTVTVRQLLSHTSGLPVAYEQFFGWPGASSCQKAATRALAGPLPSRPGTTYRYSNLNYCLLGLILQRVTGQPAAQVVRNDVLAPLGISNARAAGTYDLRPGDVVHPTSQSRNFMESLGAAGNFVATARDLVRIVDALTPERRTARLLRPSTVQQMLAKPGVGPSTWSRFNPWYGLGLIVYDQGGSWGHTGTVEGARTMVLHRADGVTWAILIAGRVSYSAAQLRSIMDQAVAAGRY